MNPVISHSSVRIKGTEDNYDPIICQNPDCTKRQTHMHCPFCPAADSYQDPVILKAHFRVKHVDKGIDFAGLRILRCCDHCDIVGAIKGVKEFKGAHWHCYKCKNGFNRRDEAIKHYRTHFRNPHTTFQIQISEEVNTPYMLSAEASHAVHSITHQLSTVQDLIGMQLEGSNHMITSDMCGIPGKKDAAELHVSVAANETVETLGTSHVIIMEATEDAIRHSLEVPSEPLDEASMVMESDDEHWRHKLLQLNQKVQSLIRKNELLEQQKIHIEEQLSIEIQTLKEHIASQNEELDILRKREQDLFSQINNTSEDRISSILTQMRDDHEQLLQSQLSELKRACGVPLSHTVTHMSSSSLHSPSTQSSMVQTMNNGAQDNSPVQLSGLIPISTSNTMHVLQGEDGELESTTILVPVHDSSILTKNMTDTVGHHQVVHLPTGCSLAEVLPVSQNANSVVPEPVYVVTKSGEIQQYKCDPGLSMEDEEEGSEAQTENVVLGEEVSVTLSQVDQDRSVDEESEIISVQQHEMMELSSHVDQESARIHIEQSENDDVLNTNTTYVIKSELVHMPEIVESVQSESNFTESLSTDNSLVGRYGKRKPERVPRILASKRRKEDM